MRLVHIFLFGLLVFAASCSQSTLESEAVLATRAYFPLKVNQYRSYQVDQTIYRLNEPTETRSFQIREVLRDTFLTEGNEWGYPLERYYRPNGLENWQLDSVWHVRDQEGALVQVEHNVPYVKMRFPLEEFKSWDGNVYNTGDEQLYVCGSVGIPRSFNGQDFRETVEIVQSSDSSLVSKDYRYEIYGKDVGLLHKHTEFIVYCNDPETDCFGKKIIERGIISDLKVFDYGELDE